MTKKKITPEDILNIARSSNGESMQTYGKHSTFMMEQHNGGIRVTTKKNNYSSISISEISEVLDHWNATGDKITSHYLNSTRSISYILAMIRKFDPESFSDSKFTAAKDV